MMGTLTPLILEKRREQVPLTPQSPAILFEDL